MQNKARKIPNVDIEPTSSAIQELSCQQRNKTVKMCKFYSSFGHCKFGEWCKFIHSEDTYTLNRRRNINDYAKNISLCESYRSGTCSESELCSYLDSKTATRLDDDQVSASDGHQASASDHDQISASDHDQVSASDDHQASASDHNQISASDHDQVSASDDHQTSASDHRVPAPRGRFYRSYIQAQNKNYPSNEKRVPPACYFFEKGFCKKGENCKFYHHSVNFTKYFRFTPILKTQEKNKEENSKNENLYHGHEQTQNENYQITEVRVTPKMSDIIPSYYFNNGSLKRGEDRKFVRDSTTSTMKFKMITIPKTQEKRKEKNENNSSPRNSNFLHSLVKERDLSLLRETEIIQLKKRFPHHKVFTDNSVQTFVFTFCPSDPDWPFDVKSLEVETFFPEDYPQEICRISVLKTNDCIPDVLINFINASIKEWLLKKNEELVASRTLQEKLVFRPFLKWFDRNLEELFIIGLRKVKQDIKAKEDGIEFIPLDKLSISPEEVSQPGELLQISQHVEKTDSFEGNLNKSEVVEKLPLHECTKTKAEMKENLQLNKTKASNLSSTPNKATLNSTKITLCDLELIENAGTMSCTKISSCLQCSRCKTLCNIVTSSKKSVVQLCNKCNLPMTFNFEPSTIHTFSNILGHLDLSNCKAVDINVIESNFLIDCLNCTKQVSVHGFHYGQKFTTWCIFCNHKVIIFVGGVKFTSSTPSSITTAKLPNLPGKKEKKSGDPAIQEGSPLPDFGACKHFKRSYRWFRFPCCGKLFPCDVCHNEKETNHEMKFAYRVICGFCSKEQLYSKKDPCILCSSSMKKKSGSHWEGGKGCRNKIHMSREDRQKYSGVNKTVSKKAQGVKTNKKK